MKKTITKLSILVGTILFLVSSSAFAATVTFEIQNTALLTSLGYDTGIGGFIWDFDYTNTTSASLNLTDSAYFGQSSKDKPANGIWQVEAVDFSTPPSTSPISGTIGTLTFDGSLEWSSTYPTTAQGNGWEFRDYANKAIQWGDDIRLTRNELYDGGTVEWTVVPIPGAIWLLGSALVGLIGIRSRRLKRS